MKVILGCILLMAASVVLMETFHQVAEDEEKEVQELTQSSTSAVDVPNLEPLNPIVRSSEKPSTDGQKTATEYQTKGNAIPRTQREVANDSDQNEDPVQEEFLEMVAYAKADLESEETRGRARRTLIQALEIRFDREVLGLLYREFYDHKEKSAEYLELLEDLMRRHPGNSALQFEHALHNGKPKRRADLKP